MSFAVFFSEPLFRYGLRRMMRALAAALLVLLSPAGHALGAGPDKANDCTEQDRLRLRGVTARLENDLIADTDQNYTNGVALTLVSHDISGPPRSECLPTPIRLHARFIKAMNPKFWADTDHVDHNTWNMVARFGQAMYTPEDHTRSDLIVDDRPYAGLLYMGMTWNRRSHRPDAGYEVLDTRELTLGIIGPWSLAEHSQNLVHDVRDMDRFRGWDHQLHNEPAFKLTM
ncbi:MAG TPA: lipid A deacylase LpxR family protein, partial [Wenzhouxiangella sp.]|nr:lipid A deacylase LpxR family protein [Wenzhouxiangella sp.]